MKNYALASDLQSQPAVPVPTAAALRGVAVLTEGKERPHTLRKGGTS